MRHWKHDRLSLPTLVIAGVILLVAASASGSVFKTGTDVQISNLHAIDDDFYVFGETLEMDGLIDGDLICFVNFSTIRGRTTQSAIIGCSDLRHQGSIDGSLRAAGYSIVIDGEIGRSAELSAFKIRLGSGSVVGRDVSAAAETLELQGTVGGDVRAGAGTVIITGRIDGNVDVTADRIRVAPSATINGNINYTSESEDALEVASGADVRGETVWRRPESDGSGGYTLTIIQISSMLAALIFGLIVVRLFRPYAEESFNQLKNRATMSFAAGLLMVVGLVLSIVVLIASATMLLAGVALLTSTGGAVLGLLFLVFSTLAIPISAFLSVTGGIIVYSGNLLVAFLIGYLIISRFRPYTNPLAGKSLLLGLAVCMLAYSLPWLGTPVYLIFTVIGSGAIMMGIRHCRKRTLVEPYAATADASVTPDSETPPNPES